MDTNDFDDLVRALVTPPSRRTLIAISVSGILGAFMYQGNDGAAKRKKCKKSQRRCGSRCIAKSRCCKSADCPQSSGQTCQNGRCVCPTGQSLCGSGCIPAGDCCQSDECDVGSGKVCEGGTCVCPPDLTDCNGTCRNLATDSNNCGGCGGVCGGGGDCNRGVCSCTSSLQCPGSCTICANSFTGGTVCTVGSASGPCDTDDECDFGVACLLSGGNGFCGNPCF